MLSSCLTLASLMRTPMLHACLTHAVLMHTDALLVLSSCFPHVHRCFMHALLMRDTFHMPFFITYAL